SRESDKIILTAPINKPITTNDSKQNDDLENDKEVNKIIPGGELYFYLKNFLKQYSSVSLTNGFSKYSTYVESDGVIVVL
ncbi:unnamed protein product, partial [Adineta steineri]